MAKDFGSEVQKFKSKYPNVTSGDIQSFAIGFNANSFTVNEIQDHLNKWFGKDWNNQSSAQIYAMILDLVTIKK